MAAKKKSAKKSKKIPVPTTLFSEDEMPKRRGRKPKAEAASKDAPVKRKPGRPKGSKNKPKTENGDQPIVRRRARRPGVAVSTSNGPATSNRGNPAVVIVLKSSASFGEIVDFLDTLNRSDLVEKVGTESLFGGG